MNTKIEYLYRDADNYKVYNSCIIRGSLTQEQREAILDCLDSGEFFIPKAVGLPSCRFEDVTEADHDWFEMGREAFEETALEPTVEVTAGELVAAFQRCRDHWDKYIRYTESNQVRVGLSAAKECE